MSRGDAVDRRRPLGNLYPRVGEPVPLLLVLPVYRDEGGGDDVGGPGVRARGLEVEREQSVPVDGEGRLCVGCHGLTVGQRSDIEDPPGITLSS